MKSGHFALASVTNFSTYSGVSADTGCARAVSRAGSPLPLAMPIRSSHEDVPRMQSPAGL
eukprot:3006627-Pyramimonas_sp.AAC.1